MRLLLAALLAATSVHATPVTFSFAGKVVSRNGSHSGGVAIGDFVDGSGSFDPASSDQDPNPGRYAHNWTSGSYYLQVNIHTSGGVIAFNTAIANGLNMWNYDAVTLAQGDYWEFTGHGTSSSPALNAAGGRHDITLSAMDGAAPYDMLDGVTPPNGLPDLGKSTLTLGWVLSATPGVFFVGFDFAPVPEPGTALMASMALAAFSVWRRRRL